MDIGKVQDEEKLRLCRIYYRAGFAFLPFLWFVNGIWFFKQAFIRDPFPEQSDIRKYVTRSLMGSLFWTIALVVWICVFQTQRVAWGATGDYMSFVYPRGTP